MATTVNYVNFIRGSKAAYQYKIDNNTIDENTLYFVYENKDSETGQLYFGRKLISGGASNISNSSIGDLKDIVISNIGDRQILIYDEEEGQWENKDVEDAIGLMIGATGLVDGSSGLAPAPKAGNQMRVLRGDGSWAKILDTILNSDEKPAFEEFIRGPIGGDQSLEDIIARIEALERILADEIEDDDDEITCCCKRKFRELKNKIKELEDAIANLSPTTPSQPSQPSQSSCSCSSIGALQEKVNNLINDIGAIEQLYQNVNNPTNKISIVEAINQLYNNLIWEEF